MMRLAILEKNPPLIENDGGEYPNQIRLDQKYFKGDVRIILSRIVDSSSAVDEILNLAEKCRQEFGDGISLAVFDSENFDTEITPSGFLGFFEIENRKEIWTVLNAIGFSAN